MNEFGFVIHPLKITDLNSLSSEKLSKRGSKNLDPFIISPPIKAYSSTGKCVRGHFVMCPLLPNQFLDLDQDVVIKKILDSCKLLEKKTNSKIVGLGGYNSILIDKHASNLDTLKLAVTNGNSLTSVMIIEGCKQIAQYTKKDLPTAKIAIVGATGSIGSACAKLLSESVLNLVLCSLSKERLENLKSNLLSINQAINVQIETSPKRAVKDADIVITATSSTKSLLGIEDLKKGAIACDVSVPPNICLKDKSKLHDIYYFKGGLSKVSAGISLGIDIGLPADVIYSCMAETIILALENRYENFSVGRNLLLERLKEIKTLAQAHGFFPHISVKSLIETPL